jgi:hypothetical protein
MISGRGGDPGLGVFDRLRRRSKPSAWREATDTDSDYLRQWVASRRGVEAFVEPETMVTETTVVLVAQDGEWTRRGVGSEAGARRIGKRLKVPVYDVDKVGYPQRMRDYTERQRILRKRAQRDELGG